MGEVQGVITQLSEQISTLNERMDEFTCRMEELNSKLTIKKASPSQLNLSVAAEACNGTGPTSLFTSGFGNGSTGSLLTNSLSSSQLAKESSLIDEVLGKNSVLGSCEIISNVYGAFLEIVPNFLFFPQFNDGVPFHVNSLMSRFLGDNLKSFIS